MQMCEQGFNEVQGKAVLMMNSYSLAYNSLGIFQPKLVKQNPQVQ